MSVPAEFKNHGVQDVFFIICDGPGSLPDSVNAVFPLASIQKCIIHLIQGTLRYVRKKHWDRISWELKPLYTAPSAAVAWAAFEEFEATRAPRYPTISQL